LASTGLTSVLAYVSVIGVVGAGLFTREAWGRAQRASVGATSEERVAVVLERTGAAVVMHGVLLGAGGDADHVVLGPVAAVVETKTGRGQVSVAGDEITAGRRTIPGAPLRQARRQARALKERTGWFTEAVVCIPDMVNGPVRTGNGVVCSLADLPGVLASFRHVCDARQAAVAVAALRKEIADV
jgi:hypothetical protein